MAELDYAFLADYAKVEIDGKLTAVGASYTHLFVAGFPGQHLVSVAGRVRAKIGEQPTLRVSLVSPEELFRIDTETQLTAGEKAIPYGPDLDTIGIQFALTFIMPLPKAGLYEMNLTLNDEHVRMLAFTAAEQAIQA
jgi:Family of unknown function (DUF6941)